MKKKKTQEIIVIAQSTADKFTCHFGGINAENVAQVGMAGADCIAVLSAVVSATNIRDAAAKLREKFLTSKEKLEVKTGDTVGSS